jgi:hypothetical protein
MAYSKQTWADGSTGNTPINATRLQHMEDGIADATPSWVLSTLEAALGAMAHPITLMVVYDAGWTIDPTLQTDSNFAWHFVGGTDAEPPPSTAGPQIWDHS